MRIFFAIMFMLVLLQGCTTNRIVCVDTSSTIPDCKKLHELNEMLSNRNVQIHFIDNATSDARNLHLTPDSSSFLSTTTGSQHTIATRELQRIEWNDRLGGAFSGSFLGILLGGTIGWVPLTWISEYASSANAISVGIMVGWSIGLVSGAIVGDQYSYEIKADSSMTLIFPEGELPTTAVHKYTKTERP